MSRHAIVRRLVGTAFAATVAATALAGFTTTAQPAAAAAPMAKCIPGTGNPMNPCPSPGGW
jgi:hypothetical protein